MKVLDLIKDKGQIVITISPDRSIFEAMGKIIDNKIGSLVVSDQNHKVVGIISERDIMRAAYYEYETLRSKKVADLMTTNIIVAIPDDEIDYVMTIMTQNRIRHLPIVTRDGIVGIISIGDIIKFQLHETQVKNHYLEEIIGQ